MDNPGRRDVLILLGSTAATALIGCTGEARSETPASTAGQQSAGCLVTPAQTEGPYFVDERLDRGDIRVDPSTGIVKAGVPLALTLRISRAPRAGCAPLAGTLVDLWHCDARGMYSDVRDRGFNTVGQKFLRGYQVTDESGLVTFQTIYPGWYSGRAVHIHFKVRTNPAGRRGLEFSSQLYFNEAITDAVHRQAPYHNKGRRNTFNESDGIYRNGGRQLTLPLVADGDGYRGTFDISVRM